MMQIKENYKVALTKDELKQNKANLELLDDVKDKKNPRSLVNILPTSMANGVLCIPQSILDLPIGDLKAHAHADPILDRIRMSFWLEYNMAQTANRDMNLTNICSGLISVSQFVKNIVSNSFKLAYIIRPTGNYTATLEDLMMKAMDQLGEILELPIRDEKGVVNTKLAQVKAQIARDIMIQARGHGVQRIDQRNLNTNVNIEAKDVLTEEQIDEKLRELNEKLDSREVKELTSGEIEIKAEDENEES